MPTCSSRPFLRSLLGMLTLSALTPAAHAGGADAPVQGATFGCRPGYVRPDFRALNAQLTQARARWAAQGLRDYRYDLKQIAAPVLFPGTRVTVQAGRVTGVALTPGAQGAHSPLAARTMEARFAEMAATLTAQNAACPLVQQSFDPVLGYPTRFASGLGDAGLADGFGEWRLTSFTPLR
ncbi:DUF6174 domain-containing protein [Deinococcus taeanensis]|uniref:DUF6174 domain-containing protein n=1 Tax=Deinococcus taeanensis TaxID=2737050 RepID=UPI001CDB7EEB|nr:DUF6174 domain-containing protein [Deinococcus taeanensis]UBV41840.1 DUF6174 domain-containing protein [Deinococcus taeanensis]